MYDTCCSKFRLLKTSGDNLLNIPFSDCFMLDNILASPSVDLPVISIPCLKLGYMN